CGAWTFDPTSPSGADSISIVSTASDSGSGLKTSGLYVAKSPNGSIWTGWDALVPNDGDGSTGSVSDDWSTLGKADGTYRLASNWWDNAGNFQQCTQDYTFDRNPPKTTLIGPTQVCLNQTYTYSMTANAQNGLDRAYFTYYKPSTSSWQTSPYPLNSTGLSGNTYSGSGTIAFATANGFSVGNSYYVASWSYDDLGMKCTGNQFYFPTPGLSGWSDCGSSSRQTVSVISTPSAVINLRGVNPDPSIVTFRWDYAGLPFTSYNISGPGVKWGYNGCYSPSNFCQAKYNVGNCKLDYTYNISPNNVCGVGPSKSITLSPNCVPTCSLSFASGYGNPSSPGTTITINSAVNAGDPGDYISNWTWSDNGPDKGSYYSGGVSRAQYTLINRYGATTTLKQSVFDSLNSSYSGTCSLTVNTADPTIVVGPAYAISITKSSTVATTQEQQTVYSSLLNDNNGTLTYNQSANLTYNSVSYKNICMETGVTCSFSGIANVTSTSIPGYPPSTPKGLYITVPRALTPGTYAYGMNLSSTKWDGTPISSQSNNLFVVYNLAPTCIKPALSEYSTYGSVGYPLGHNITVTGSGSDLDGTAVTYKWNDPNPGSGTLSPTTSTVNTTIYTTPNNYDSSNRISYSVTDSSGGKTVCPVSDYITTLVQPGLSTSWYNYSIDINKTLTDTKTFTWTQDGTSAGFYVATSFGVDISSSTVGGMTNICKIAGVTCNFAPGITSISQSVAGATSLTSKNYSLTITVPTSLGVENYGVRISGSNTYRGTSYPFDSIETVFITASTSDISITCADGSTGNCYTFTQNRGWVSGDLIYLVKSNGFTGTFNLIPDGSSLCGVAGVTCTVSPAGGTFSLTENESKTVYLNIQATLSSPLGSYNAKFKSTGIRATVGTSTGEKTSPATIVTLNNQAPTCGTPTYSFNPNTPVSLASTVKVVVGGGADPDSDPLTYGSWSVTSANSITAVSGEINSANVVMNNVYNSCTEVRYKVYDNNSGVSATCVVPSTLCTILDSVPPQASLTTGANSVCKGISYPVAFNYTDNEVLTEVSINKKDPVSVVSTNSGNFGTSTSLSSSTTFDTAGTYYVYPVAKDANNNICDSSGSISCGTGTLKEVTVNENSSAPTMSFVTYAYIPTKVRVTWTKPSNLAASNYTLGGTGTLSTVTCSGDNCGVDITELNCASSYSYTLSENDENTCNATSTIENVSPNCAPTCSTPTVANSLSVYPLDTSQTINSMKSVATFDSEDGDSVTHIWAPSLSGAGLGEITAGGADATYLTPNRNNITVQVVHSVRDTGGPNDDNFVIVSCGAVSFPMVPDGLNNYSFNPGSITVARNTANPSGTSNFGYDLSNYQDGTFTIDTTNTDNSSFIGNNICVLTSLLTCVGGGVTASVGNGRSLPATLTFGNDARVNFDTTKTYKIKGTVTYSTTDTSVDSVSKNASAYLNVSVSDTAPTCKVYSRLNSADAWADVTGQYFTYSKGTNVQVRTVGSDADADTIGSYSWSTSAGTISPTDTQESAYTVLPVDGLNASVTGRVNESVPNNLYGTCSTVMKTPDPGTHIIAAGSINGSSTSATIAYSYSGYVNDNNGIGVNGTSTISSGAIAGYINICTVSGVTCTFEGQSVGTGLMIGSGSSSSKNIIVDLGSVRLDNTKSYAAKVLFSAPTADGGTITASTTGGVIAIMDAVPTCGNISMSPANSVLSGSSDALTITALGFDDWTMSSAKLEYNSNITGTNAGTWTTIGTVSSFASVVSPSAVFSWAPGSFALGRYQLRVTWTDNKSPTGQTVTCSALDSTITTTDPSSPTDTNNAVVTVNGNRLSGRVFIQSDGPSNSVIYKTVSKDAVSNPFVITSSEGATSWNNLTVDPSGNPANCAASYPDGTADSNNCNNDFFVSNTTHLVNTSLTASIANLSNKYACTYDVWGLDASGVRVKKIANGAGCTTSPFSLETGLSSYSATTRWTTEVDFYLTYNTDQVGGFVYTNNGSNASDPLLGLSGYMISTSGYASGSSISSGSYAFPDSADSANYLPDGNRSFTITGANIGSSASSKKCFYAFRNDGINSSFTYQNMKTIVESGSVSGWTTGEGCTTPNLTIAHGNLSPQRQNYLYFFIVPKIIIDPASTVTLVKSCTDSTIINDPIDPTINLYNSSGNPIGEDTYDSGTKMFSIVNNDGSGVKTELLWNSLYEARLSINVNFIICNNGSPSFTVGTVSTQPNVVNADLPSYPSLTDTENQVKFTFEVAYKNSNNWWQVYNGGVHANGIMDLVKLPQIDVSGTATPLPLIENPTLNNLATYYTGALASSSDTGNVIGLGFGKAGNSPSEWATEKLNNKMDAPYDNKFFDDVQSSWTIKPNFVSATGSANPIAVYVDNGDQSHDNSNNKNKYARPIVIIGNLAINADLLVDVSSSSPLVIIVQGDVSIAKSVQLIEATIYATGTITVNTQGDETDPVLTVKGSLIANQFDFKRDLPNIPSNNGVPSQRIVFDPKVLSNSSIPVSMKQVNAYWVISD
ncbi:hypothetical protein CO058_02710, partial [candidate division WWE3 bacterium CG_4_9_14_0_2_um_filter_35_11]